MKKLKLGLLLAGLASMVSFSSTPASAAAAGLVRTSLLGGLNIGTNGGGSTGYTAGLDFGFWLGAADITVGAEYLSRAYTSINSLNYVEIPLLLNFHMGPIFSIGGGGFYDIALTSGAVKNYGVGGSLKIKPALMPLFVEGRYNYGLNSSEVGINTQEIKALIGFVF